VGCTVPLLAMITRAGFASKHTLDNIPIAPAFKFCAAHMGEAVISIPAHIASQEQFQPLSTRVHSRKTVTKSWKYLHDGLHYVRRFD
jgi:hypothetical protein